MTVTNHTLRSGIPYGMLHPFDSHRSSTVESVKTSEARFDANSQSKFLVFWSLALSPELKGHASVKLRWHFFPIFPFFVFFMFFFLPVPDFFFHRGFPLFSCCFSSFSSAAAFCRGRSPVFTLTLIQSQGGFSIANHLGPPPASAGFGSDG